ncbi:MAG: hypothetical protein IT361_12555 [Gemmatimonadaceae bacterium]|nr:hypothetical protein [Gemmatimonadaceae bacterium]
MAHSRTTAVEHHARQAGTGSLIAILPRLPGRSITAYGWRDTLPGGTWEIIGDGSPAMAMTQHNEIRWRRWRLTTAVDGIFGVRYPNEDQYRMDRLGLSDDADGGLSRAASVQAQAPVYVQDAAYLRLREVAVSLPLRRSPGGPEVHAEVAIRNALTWSRFDNLDPTSRRLVTATSARFGPAADVPIMRALSVALSYGFNP